MGWLPGDPLLPNFFCETIYSFFDYYYNFLSSVPGLEGYSLVGFPLTFPRSSCSKVLTIRNACHTIPPSLSLHPLLTCHLLISHYLSTVRLFFLRAKRAPVTLQSTTCVLLAYLLYMRVVLYQQRLVLQPTTGCLSKQRWTW